MSGIHRVTFSRLAAALVVLAAVCLSARPASARPRAAADDALVTSLLGHADRLSAILEKHVDQPRQALAALERHLGKQRKPMKKLVARLIVVAGELDDEDRAALGRGLLWSERSQRLVAAIASFVDKHGDDPRYEAKIDRWLAEIEGEGKTLMAALLR